MAEGSALQKILDPIRAWARINSPWLIHFNSGSCNGCDIEILATLTPRYAWEVTLSDGVHLTLGRDPAADTTDPHGRSGALPFAARIERFVRAWPELTRRLGTRLIASADLRYPNGFAITLAPENNASTTKP